MSFGIRLEPHFQAISEVSRCALMITEALPETDTTLELVHLLTMQADILTDLIEGKHFGSRALEQITTYCQQTCNDLETR